MLKHGTYLAQRWEADDEGRGFFVEVGVAEDGGQAVVLGSFVSSVPLENYSHYVRLPEGWA